MFLVKSYLLARESAVFGNRETLPSYTDEKRCSFKVFFRTNNWRNEQLHILIFILRPVILDISLRIAIIIEYFILRYFHPDSYSMLIRNRVTSFANGRP